MPNIDLTSLLPLIIGIALPFLMTMFPGLRNIFTMLPNSFYDTVVALKGGKITWGTLPNAKMLQLELTGLVARGAANPDNPEHDYYMGKQREYAAIGDGTIMEWIKKNWMIIAIVIGGAVFMTKGGGCKPNPTPAPVVKSVENPSLLLPGGN